MTFLAALLGTLAAYLVLAAVLVRQQKAALKLSEKAEAKFLNIRLTCSKCGHQAAFVRHEPDVPRGDLDRMSLGKDVL